MIHDTQITNGQLKGPTVQLGYTQNETGHAQNNHYLLKDAHIRPFSKHYDFYCGYLIIMYSLFVKQ